MKTLFSALLFFVQITLFAQVTPDPCIENHAFKIVVLGSSTAAGSGPSHPDSAWVNRYRAALQQINPQNQVINLAVGGYTTYRIMPNSFVPPANRPAVDTLNNITKALSLNPDAIIVNLPSNDRQWPMSEQLSNFDSLYNHSWNNGVPFFVCTTQPIQPLNSATYQRSVRDSIINQYGQFAIELFLPLADTNNTVLSVYAADAVHLNDSGHAVIFDQVWNADVLGKSFSPRSIPDLTISSVILPSQHCADSLVSVGWIVANLGDTVNAGVIGYAKSSGPLVDSISLLLGKSLLPCQTDTIWGNINLSQPGSYLLSANITLPLDTITDNNGFYSSHYTVPAPVYAIQNDTLCKNDLTAFSANLISGDTLLWYSSLLDTVPLITGQSFALQRDTSVFIQAITGDLTFKEVLGTTNEANINFNGNMFDLFGLRDLVLNEIEIRPNNIGQVPIKVYAVQGSYRGIEGNASAWTLLYHDTVQVNTAGDYTTLDIVDVTLNAGDTIGIYVHMTNSGQSLKYRGVSQVSTYSNNELQFISGSGIGYTFGTVYNNRVLNGRFHYSYGFNRFGECASDLVEVFKTISRETIDIGPDTILPYTGITLQLDSSYPKPVWIDVFSGDTLSTQSHVVIDSANLHTGSNQIEVVCFCADKWGCAISDTIVLTLLKDFGISHFGSENIEVYPNPVSHQLRIESDEVLKEVKVISVSGQMVFQSALNAVEAIVQVKKWPSGLYILVLKTKDGHYARKIIKR